MRKKIRMIDKIRIYSNFKLGNTKKKENQMVPSEEDEENSKI